jgi:hypothetical protein
MLIDLGRVGARRHLLDQRLTPAAA